ncbi:MAG: ketosteroid isomerase-like protein [Myxococcota bacterium]|jgi:ketosteroid isomerase-like protein
MILNGQSMEAFEKLYAEDVVMQEPTGIPREGKDANRTFQQAFFSNVEQLHGMGCVASAYNTADNVGLSQWWIDITFKDGTRNRSEQASVRTFRDDLLVREQFFYNSNE